MPNVPGLNVGGTGTSAVQSQGAIPVVASGGKVFTFSAVGTSGHFLRSGGTGVPTWFNLFNTANSWTARQDFTGSVESFRLVASGTSNNRVYQGFYKLDATPTLRTGYFGQAFGATNDMYLQNELAGGHNVLATTGGNLYVQHASFSPGAGGSAAGVIALQNCATPPTANPVGGVFIYAEGGAAKVRGASGQTTVFGPAHPHCRNCGQDFVIAFEHMTHGKKAWCLPCLVAEMTRCVPGFNISAFSRMAEADEA